jgi:hypothetical protein
MIHDNTGNVHTAKHRGAFVQPLVQWKSNKCNIFWVCVCSLRYSACNAHAPYCHLWPARLYKIFPHYLINGTIFAKKRKSYLTQNVCFDFLHRNISHAKKKWARYDHKISGGLHVKYLLFLSDCNETWIFSKFCFFEKYSNFKCYETPSNGSRVVPCGQTDGRDVTGSRLSQFCEVV